MAVTTKEIAASGIGEWFAVDRKGLGQLIERHGRARVILELLQNGWDQDVKRVFLELRPHSKGYFSVSVTDDDPQGFSDLSHAFTLYAPSTKLDDAEKRGRFNLGEKIVLALCKSAKIGSTTGTVIFDETGRSVTKDRTDVGSYFEAIIRFNQDDFVEVQKLISNLIPPVGIDTFFNGQKLAHREPIRSITATLDTEVANGDGILRRTRRKTQIELYRDEKPHLYEMGIPVQKIGTPWSVNVGQKIPLNFERTGVNPAYLKQIHVAALDGAVDLLTEADAPWIKDAFPVVTKETREAVIKARFGDLVVAFDPSDPDSKPLATLNKYEVVMGRSFSKDEWAAIKRDGLIKSASELFPSRTKRLNDQRASEGTGGTGEGKSREISPERWTDEQREVVRYAKVLFAQFFPDITLTVRIESDITAHAVAWMTGFTLTFNIGRLGKRWFSEYDQQAVDELLLHEFAHILVHEHLSENFHDELCRLGALMAKGLRAKGSKYPKLKVRE